MKVKDLVSSAKNMDDLEEFLLILAAWNWMNVKDIVSSAKYIDDLEKFVLILGAWEITSWKLW